jgi:hypothetical protein
VGEQFDLFAARAARDLGFARVEMVADDWIDIGLQRIRALPAGFEGNGEEICRYCNMPKAPTPGAVGSMVRQAAQLNLLRKTGEMRQPHCVKSHARATYVWKRTIRP